MVFNFGQKQGAVSAVKAVKSSAAGVIEPAVLYRADEAKARVGWGRDAFSFARRRGLRVHRCGKRVYVVGADLIAYVTGENGGRDDSEVSA